MLEKFATILFFSSVHSTFMLPVDKETYKTLVKSCKDDFTAPVVFRYNSQKAAVIKYRRKVRK